MVGAATTTSAIDAFIARWAMSSGAERANFQMFAFELCGLLGVAAPEPARGDEAELNDYCFERGIQFKGADGTTSPGRIDLYKRGAFVIEAKQSREKGRPKELKFAGQPDLFNPDYTPRGERSANRAWDQLMISARHQAQEYARALPIDHGWPTFVLVCDVGHCIEVYADFSGQGKNYAQFPDRQGFRIYLSDLRDEQVRARLKLIWEQPTALDPSRQSAKVTREIAARLAQVSKGLEARGHNAEDVALFLMRCLFTMFAEDVELLRQEWSQVQATAERFKIEADQLEREAEEAGSKSRLAAGGRSVSAIRANEAAGKRREAVAVLRSFHSKLCQTRVLDPACGTGNFLYVSLALMKQLEGEVLEAISDLAGPQDDLTWLASQTVDPHQFLGLELNPRAAAIAELVIWLGYLQWHFRTKGEAPPEPILHDFRNITVMDAVLTWDGYPAPKVETKDGKRIETYPNARRPDWPEAEYIVGNPPFIGGKDIRANQGDGYTQTLWAVHKAINDSADFVMYWWDRAAEIVAKSGVTQRFGFVTTNSITQTFSRRVVARHLEGKKPISLLMAIPDHPWTKATDKAAAVRIAMTVASAGRHLGVLREVTREAKLDTDQPEIEFAVKMGRINADLTVGVDVTRTEQLRANEGVSSPGVKLHGSGFIVTPNAAEALGLGKRPGLDQHIRPYRNGRDLMATPRGVMVIDLDGFTADEVRLRYPEIYQHVLEKVKPERDKNNEQYRRDNWWLFGRKNTLMRGFTAGLPRYIATVETAKHRVFQFLDGAILPDNKLVTIGSDDAIHLGVLSSRAHVVWALRAGGWLGVGNDSVYVKSRCFDPFPFPDCSDELATRIRAVAEELDAHRKARQAEHPRLTLTQMYNVLEALRADGGRLPTGESPSASEDFERIKTEGLVLILKELHDRLDALVFEAYGWPATLTDEEILTRLVGLNQKRALEEKAGIVKWLRPEYQIPRFGSDAERARLAAEKAKSRDDQFALIEDEDDEEAATKPKFQTGNELAETADVMRVLATATQPLGVEQIARTFAQGKAVEKRIALTILALARLGHLSSTDGGETFTLRRLA